MYVWIIYDMLSLRISSSEKPYGDQTLFMKRRTYKTVGGFPTYFLMEDYILVCKETKYDPLHVYDALHMFLPGIS